MANLTTAQAAERLAEKRRKEAARHRAIHAERKALGVCTECGGERKPGRSTCSRHAAMKAAESKARADRNRPHRRALDKKVRERLRQRVLEKFGGTCACCGETEIKFLGIDHINGNNHPIHQRRLGAHWYTRLLAEGTRDDFQVLCHNCNMAKGFYGRCPHQGE